MLFLLSFLLIAFAISVRFQHPTHTTGMMGIIVGLGVVFYGFRAYQLGLTRDPLEMLLTCLAFGGVAILSYPTTLFDDWFIVGLTVPGTDSLPSPSTPNCPWLWRVLWGLFMIAIVLAGVATVLYGINAARAHFASPP